MSSTNNDTNISTKVSTNNEGVSSNIVPITFKDALIAQSKQVQPHDLFSLAYEWGNTQVIPDTALAGVWPQSSIADDKVSWYFDNVYFVQYCALQYWQVADNADEAEIWRSKGMDAWGKILDAVGCTNKRHNTDWLYLVSRATIDGKADKDSKNKIIKPASKASYRKRVELLIGMAIKGFVFVNPMESLEAVQQVRAAKSAAKEAKAAESAKKAEEKAANNTAKAKGSTKGKTKKAKVAAAVVDEPALAEDVMPLLDEAVEAIVQTA